MKLFFLFNYRKLINSFMSFEAKTFFSMSILMHKISIISNFDNDAFFNTSIGTFLISSSVLFIGKSVFGDCKHLKKVEFQENSKVKLIFEAPFSHSNIEFQWNSKWSFCRNFRFLLCTFLSIYLIEVLVQYLPILVK